MSSNFVWRKKYSITLIVITILLFLLLVGLFSLFRECANPDLIAGVIDKLADTLVAVVVSFYGADVIDKMDLIGLVQRRRGSRTNPEESDSSENSERLDSDTPV